MQRRGIFVALYGINGIGKSRQTSMLAERFREGGKLPYARAVPHAILARLTA